MSLLLSQIVYSYISATEKPDSSFRRIYDIALRGYKWMNLHAVGMPTTVELEVLANKTCVLPEDYLSMISIGVLNSDGEVDHLIQNSDLALIVDREDLPDDYTGDITEVRSMRYNTYRLDLDARMIVLSPDFTGEVLMLEYLPMFVESADDYIVNPLFEEAMIGYIRWQDSIDDRNRRAERMLNKQDFFNELHNARRAAKRVTLSDLYQSYKLQSRTSYKKFLNGQ